MILKLIQFKMASCVVCVCNNNICDHPKFLYVQVVDHLMAGIENVIGMHGRNDFRVSLALPFMPLEALKNHIPWQIGLFSNRANRCDTSSNADTGFITLTGNTVCLLQCLLW